VVLDPCAEAGSAKSIAPLVVVVVVVVAVVVVVVDGDGSVGPPTPPIPTPLPCLPSSTRWRFADDDDGVASSSKAATCDRVAFDLATARWWRSGSALRKKRC
jgi:hypothetical protein